MLKLKVNLKGYGRENFMDEVQDLHHELSHHGSVVSYQVILKSLAQFTFSSNVSVSELKRLLEAYGLTEETGLSVQLYNDDSEFEGQ